MRDMSNKGRASKVRGEKTNGAKLTGEKVAMIRMARGLYKDIAAEFGVHPSHISRIKRGIYWAEIEKGMDMAGVSK